jgi:U2 snRNP spliceosome subunit
MEEISSLYTRILGRNDLRFDDDYKILVISQVQENCIDLVGRIADRGPEYVSAREWMRICFELLELLKAHKKAIRRATVNTFGYIAKAIGPHDVLATLLNNLKVKYLFLPLLLGLGVSVLNGGYYDFVLQLPRTHNIGALCSIVGFSKYISQ